MQAPNAAMPVLPLRAALVAGETSGDLLAAELLRAMAQRWPAPNVKPKLSQVRN